MQVLDDEKRLAILKAAAELFCTQPFHKVKLSDVASRATVGKGTLYTYFKNKDDLYLSVFEIGFVKLLERIQSRICLEQGSPEQNMEHAIREMVGFAFRHPELYQIMRRYATGHGELMERWQAKRAEMKAVLEAIISRGVEENVFYTPNPELVSWIIPGIVRSAVLNAGADADVEKLIVQIQDFVFNALRQKKL